MAKVLTEVDTYAATVTVPEDGDVRSAGSVETPLQTITDRTKYLNTRKAALSGAAFTGAITNTSTVTATAFAYTTPLSYNKQIPIGSGSPVTAASFLVNTGGGRQWSFDVNSRAALWPIHLANGCTLDSVRAVVYQSNAGASGQMTAKVYKMEDDGAFGVETELATVTYAAGVGHKTTAMTVNEVIDNSTYNYYVYVVGSALAGTIADSVRAIRMTVTDPAPTNK